MSYKITTPHELGVLVRAVRKAQGLRQDDAAGSIGVSENFLSKIERGGERVQWGKLLQVLHELGIHLYVEIPDDTASVIESLGIRQTKK